MLRRTLLTGITLTGLALLMSACNPQLDSSVATFNANATQLAGGGQSAGTLVGPAVGTLEAGLTPSPTLPANVYDLTADQTQLLVSAWGKIYGLPVGAEFQIKAGGQQVTRFVVDNLQIQGLADTVKGGNVTLGQGQFRMDLAILDTAGVNGGVTVTFQPSLDETAALKLNPLGSEFGTLSLPPALIPSLGDSVHTTLTGAKNDSLSKVQLHSILLENDTMVLTGVVK
jgi:hypothetical protein